MTSYTYSFSDNQNASKYFNLVSNTGRITTKIEIDREALNLQENQFNILIIGKNSEGNSDPVEVSIEVLDVNDNPPIFPESIETVHFRENSQSGLVHYLPTATDADYGDNADVSQYRIISGDGPFEVEFNPQMYGDVLIIKTTGPLDREKTSSYTITIEAKDSGDDPKTGTVQVNIKIDDENDHAPIFDPSTRNAQVNETDPIGTFVIQVIASDLDEGVNQDITYSIADKNEEAKQFRIDESVGQIFTTKQPLYCQNGQCLLTVVAVDKGVPSYSGQAFVYINVIDTNNHDPTIQFIYVPSGNNFSSVNEDAVDGDDVAGIMTNDQDVGPKPTARIIAGNELRHFRFVLHGSGRYSVQVNGDSVLDRERHHVYNLTIEAQDSGNPPRIAVYYLVIYVNDINDHAPEFLNKQVRLAISETTPVGSFIASMIAIDLDSGTNAKLTYKIESGNSPDWFDIDRDTGLVTTKTNFNYKIKHAFVMNISVQDGALRPLIDYARLEINIWDENNMAPLFSQTVFNVNLEESSNNVSPVVFASALDDDSGLNGTLVYQFHPYVELTYPNTFHIDSRTGDVTTKKPLDRETIPFYTIRILAKDTGPQPLTSTATVSLTVTDINDNSPVFYPKQYYATVLEGLAKGTIVVKVTAIDADIDENGKVTYSFASSDFGNFEIEQSTGLIRTTRVLQKSSSSSFTLSVLARDPFGLTSDNATVHISVISTADTMPYFETNYVFNIPEDYGDGSAHVGVNIGKVSAKADASASTIAYSIVGGDSTNIFQMNTATGWIKRMKKIDREIHPTFNLKVVATVGNKYGETNVVINIEDVNDNVPVFEYPYREIDIMENWPVGHHIAIVLATDADAEGPNSKVSYSLQNNGNAMFDVEADTGLLYLNKPLNLLDASKVVLTVVARDAGSSSHTAQQELRLTVQDVNDHTPKFPHSEYEISLLESSSVNTRFFEVVAVDDDLGDNGRLTFNITRGNEDRRFGLFPDGFLYIAQELDRETKDLYKLSIVAHDNGTPQRSSECNITVHVIDSNDNKPIFLNASYDFGILENKPVGTFVGFVKASDKDIGRNSEVSYSFNSPQTDFNIDVQSGEITAARSFDREQLAGNDYMIVFDVLVKDNGLTRLEDIVTVRVTIHDENDNSPIFKQPVYKITKFENEAILSNITVVAADDIDDGINSIVTYNIIGGNDDGRFMIMPTTGQISLLNKLDRETEDFYEITVLATDSGTDVRHNATCKVQITIADINDNFPLFAQTQMDVSVVEDMIPGSEVAHFPATDIDIGINAEISYRLSGTDDDGMFVIDRNTGKIYLQRSLDYETKNKYRLNVTASDKGVPPLAYYVQFSVTIEDVNDNAPVFQNEPLSFAVTENESSSVTKMTASDADSGRNGEVNYDIVYQDPPGDNFKIVRSTGQIYVDKPIDREVADLYKLSVVAYDLADDTSDRLSTETIVTINIKDENDNDPIITSFNAIAVPKTTPRNDYITTITVKDADVGNNGKTSMLLTQSGFNLFSLESQTGRLMLTNNIPSNSVKYTVTLQVNDYGLTQRTTQTAVTILITNNDNGPAFQSQPYSGTVDENSVLGKSILRVQAISSSNSVLEYYVTNITHSNSGKQAERYFQVDKSTGVLSTARLLDREEVGEAFEVEIYAVENSGSTPRTSFITAHVDLIDVNDTPPRFTKNYYTADIDEDVRLDFPVIRIPVYDDDSLGGLQLSIDTNEGLKIRQDGTIVTTGPLDRETKSQYNLRVTATDGIKSSYCMVRINLRDVNDNAPVFSKSLYSFDVYEDTLIDTTVGSVRATDPDQGQNGHVTYSLSSGYGNDTFSLDPVRGTFTLLRRLDFEENQLYSVDVIAYDAGDPAQSSSVRVYFNVKDTNDNAPLFEQGTYDVAIYENVTIATSVAEVLAHDVDSGVNGDVNYRIISGDNEQQFRIDETSGAIYTSAQLDRETTPTYNLVVWATDKAEVVTDRRTATAEVLMTILDVNDYIPVIISPSTISVKENQPLSTVVHTVQVRDLDDGVNSQVDFRISSKSGRNPFSIGTKDGKLRVNTNIDREAEQNYTVTITVQDLGHPSLSSSQQLFVVIADENDHNPVFSPEFYDKSVREDVAIGTTLLQVSATDLDFGFNGIVKYFIIGGDVNYDFSMDQSSGVLRVQKSLDYERVSEYKLIIQAEDSGDDTRYSTATVSISVQDVNDNTPMFLDSPYMAFVRENMDHVPLHVIHVSASDEDSAPYNQLKYAIREGPEDIFNMSATTGEIMVLKKLDREQKSGYVLTVVVTDSDTGRGLTGTGTVSVYVEDVNDNPPIFEHVGNYIAHVSENMEPNTNVVVVKATDKDEGSNAQIIYTLKDDIGGKFVVYPDTGEIVTNMVLDREDDDQYSLEVVAMDTSLLPLSATTSVVVYIDDINDNAPQFSSSSYTCDLRLPAPIGTFVVGVTASDADSGVNRLVEYSLSNSDASYFNVDKTTGVITVRQSLVQGKTYNFKVTATDKGSPVKSSSVPVSVTTTGSSGVSPPTFDPVPNDLKVLENLPLEHNIVTVTARSSSNSRITYSIAGGNLANAFGINSSTGRIYVNGTIDYELLQQYHLWIQAVESGSLQVSSNVEVVIDIEDVNDNAPKFTKTLYEVSVLEDKMFGTTIATVRADDPDSGNNGAVSYTLTGADSSKFRVDSQSGKITTYTSLDREKIDSYSLTVIASDAGNQPLSSTASIRITILDVNDESPKFTHQFRIKIPENTAVGSFVLRVTSSDNDIGENAIATYSLTEDTDGIFGIEPASGNITLLKPLNAEVTSSYNLKVAVTDNAHVYWGNVEVDVSDVNDNSPVLIEPLTFDFEEMLPIGSEVGVLHATDADVSSPNNKVYFSLKLASSYFALDSDTGVITSLEELTFDPSMDLTLLPNRHELVVIAKDLGTPVRSSEKSIFINIGDYNDHAPVFDKSEYESAVPDMTPAGNSILSVHAEDINDYGDNAKVEYFLTSGNGSSFFNVDRFSGIVSVSQSLLGYRNKIFHIVIKAEDKGTQPLSSLVNVKLTVTGNNLYAPVFVAPASKQITVNETLTVGSLIETFVANDSDRSLNAEIMYEISGGNLDDTFEMEKDSGKLLVKGPLDYEVTKVYQLNITARDKALNYKQTTISYTIRLRDVNDNDPIFGQTDDIVFIDENSSYGSIVYHAVAVDNDSGDNAKIKYAIVGVGTDASKFSIDEDTGIVTTKGELDYEKKDKYSLTIMALNDPDSTKKSTMSLTVYVEGVNEFVPQFVQATYYFSISESAETKTSVGRVSATDADDGQDGIVNYFLVGESNAKGFKIDPRTGVILVSGKPDYESSPQITLEVLAKNWGSVKGNDTDTCLVHISVQDANDAPKFTQDVYLAHVLENSGADVSVLTVVAEDNDFEVADRSFSYTILGGNAQRLFRINSKTGYISTTGRGTLDRETIPVYNITVGAVDTGSPPETGSALVKIFLDDVNDNGPQFTNFTASVTEGQASGIQVTSLSQFTTDPDDVGNRDPYTYFLLGGTHMEYEYFDISQTGVVKTKKALDRESIPQFNVPVIVKDSGSKQMSSTLTFKVTVSDINDTPPSPRFLTIFLNLFNGRVPDDPIADVRPVDEDITGNPTCVLVTSNTPFKMAADSCRLHVNSIPSADAYTLEIEGSDGSVTEKNTVNYEISVKVNIFDNTTLGKTSVLEITGMTSDQFIALSYTPFMTELKKAFNNLDNVMLYALDNQVSGNLLVYLAVQKASSSEYYSVDNIIQRVSDVKSKLESAAGLFILNVDFTKCVESGCKNGGKCINHVTVGFTNRNADSLNQAFSNPILDLLSVCNCPAQYTGHDCSEEARPCGSTYCQNGGTCGNQNKCQCPPEWKGTSCEIDVDECQSGICQNGGSCQNTAGSFKCHCPDGFVGKTCQDGDNFCRSDPCLKGTCKNLVDKFQCECPYGYWGDLCQFTSVGFNKLSYMVFPQLAALNNEIEVTFATQEDNALLLYNPSSVIGSTSFLALEILDGRIRFSVALGTEEVRRVTINMMVNTGSWFKVKVNRNREMSRVWVEDCPDDGTPCTECQIGTACYGQNQTQNEERLDVGNHNLLLGGVKTIETILNRTGQVASHDFVGCIRSFLINGQDKLQVTAIEKYGILNECPRKSSEDMCRTDQCNNDGSCYREWSHAVCHCTSKYNGPTCEQELKPFEFSADSFVKITMKENVRRDQQVSASTSSRRRRATTESSVMVRFRTTTNMGVIFFASYKGSKIGVLSVYNGKLKFTVKQYGGSQSVTMETPSISDGKWHNATILVTASDVTLQLDSNPPRRENIPAFLFSSHDVQEMTLGGISSSVNSITVDNESLKDFNGCISVFKLDGEALPMNGSTSVYNIQAVGGISNGCTSLCANNACNGQKCSLNGEGVLCSPVSTKGASLNIGIIIMIVFFVVLLIAIVIVVVILRKKRALCMKQKQQKQNGVPFTNSANSSGHSNQDSGYGENNIDKLIIRNHIAQELAGSNYNRQNGHLMKPDIIKSEVNRSPMPLEIEDGTVIIDNASDVTHLRDLNGEMAEHYDLENASSIAPSDIDVVDYYRHFPDGGRSRRKKAHSDHSHNSKHSSRHFQSNHGSQHSHPVRDSPNLLTSVPYMNDLARSSPNNLKHSPINQLSRQSPNVRQSPLTHVNMHGHKMPVTDLNGGSSRATSDRSLASQRSKHSCSTPNKPKRQMLPNGQPPSGKKPVNHNYENGKFLTLEEVDRLNARPRESPASLMEAFSTSSDNNTRKMQKPFEHYQDTSVLLEPPESSSDDSANDSFTCSEFEYENDKPRNDFDPNSRIFSNLTEVDNENEDGAYHNKNFKADGLDSGGNSFSSTERSSDEQPGQSKIPNNAFDWDDLLNWGPKFEKLVGVFTDIALLPDADSVDFVDVDAKTTDREEYV
ncbi:Protocadherin Fat 4 [Mactra antiquata]